MSFVGNLITQMDKSDPTYKKTEWAIKHTAGGLYIGMSVIALSMSQAVRP